MKKKIIERWLPTDVVFPIDASYTEDTILFLIE
jgi:hypothetical protein